MLEKQFLVFVTHQVTGKVRACVCVPHVLWRISHIPPLAWLSGPFLLKVGCLLQEGNIFIVDYELLDGIDANKTDPCTHQFLAAPICLLYKNLANKIVPIAIQVGGCSASALLYDLDLKGPVQG